MISIPKGTKDVLPRESYRWHTIEAAARKVADCYHIREVRTPVFEHTELFLRGVGDTTDVVNKEMYTFSDKGGRSLTLKPEGTAGVARSFVENNLATGALPVKMYYFTPVFRYERPQAGRLREHHQFGVEVYGSAAASMDAEVISVADSIFKNLGIADLKLNINSIGCPKCRGKYNEALRRHLERNFERLCGTCRERLEKNPLRVLDCKEDSCREICKDAPVILNYLCEECETHFAQLKQNLELLGIRYAVDPKIVRGLDYYTKTVFEFVSETIGAKGTVCGGGRYDGLVESIGGKPVCGVGFGMGLERLLLQMDAAGLTIEDAEIPTAFIVGIGEETRNFSLSLCQGLRQSGISCEIDHEGKGLKAQFKQADRLSARYVVVIGSEELASGKLTVKNMKTGEQSLCENDLNSLRAALV